MKIVVLTGAGISAESGIETFRSQDGLWCNHKIEDVASPEGFKKNPDLVHNFYNQRRKQLLNPKIKPNQAHFALSKLEKELSQYSDHQFLLISQNIDNLHTRSGSQNLIQMHGELLKIRCTHCDEIFDCHQDCTSQTPCPSCNQTKLRPNIVWFGEMPLKLDQCFDALAQCDLFAAIGTSGLVYPAAGFADVAYKNGAQCVEINLERTSSGAFSPFSEFYIGKASVEVDRWVLNVLDLIQS